MSFGDTAYENIFICFFLIISNETYADLACSANGLNILYINGVNVEEYGNRKSRDNVQGVINPIKTELDNKNVNLVQGVWNTSRQLLNDIEELKAQLAANHQGKKRAEFWKAFANLTYSPFNNTKEFDEALEQITSGKNIPLDKNGHVIDQDFYSKTDFYKDLVIYNPKLANLLANASSDVAVVSEMKVRINVVFNIKLSSL